MDSTTAPLASIGIDVGKDVFHIVGFGTNGKIAFRRKITQARLNFVWRIGWFCKTSEKSGSKATARVACLSRERPRIWRSSQCTDVVHGAPLWCITSKAKL